jgi:hypothetical protein
MEKLKVASSKEEFLALGKDVSSPHIRNLDQLGKIFADPSNWRLSASPQDNPFVAISEAAKKQFSDSVKFGDGAIAHARYALIKKELTAELFEAFWAAFGIGKRYWDDIEDATCVAEHDCAYEPDSVCTDYC